MTEPAFIIDDASSVALTRYDAAKTALAEARRVDEVKDIRDKAHAIAAYARQANDTEMVEWATEIKVRAERRAGELLREMDLHRGGRPRKTNDSLPSVIRPTLKEVGVSPKQSERWQKLAAVPDEQFEDAIEAAKEVAREVSTTRILKLTDSQMAVHYSSATDLWSTPRALFDTLDEEFGFTLDVCATPENAKCERFFTPEIDGLAQEWRGSCWMNPPYGDEIGHWIRKAFEESEAGATVVCLVPARVDTAWWWDYVIRGEIRFLKGRLRFGDATSGAPFPSAVVVFPRKPNVVWWRWQAA